MKMKNRIFIFLFSFVMLSCQESEEADEYGNWQTRCEAYIDSIAAVARANADGQWRVIRSFNLAEKDVNGVTATWANDDYVYCHVRQSGSGTTLPLFTDTVRVNYRGRLIPTAGHPEGYIFDQSYKGEVNPAFNKPTSFEVGSLTEGFCTAVQHMHVGDIWRVYIPASLAYGSSDRSSSGIPPYSTLIFDINLVGIVSP